MGYILTQPNNSPESLSPAKNSQSTDECLFDRTSSGPRLIPIFFNYRSIFKRKKKYHAFVGEIVCGH